MRMLHKTWYNICYKLQYKGPQNMCSYWTINTTSNCVVEVTNRIITSWNVNGTTMIIEQQQQRQRQQQIRWIQQTTFVNEWYMYRSGTCVIPFKVNSSIKLISYGFFKYWSYEQNIHLLIRTEYTSTYKNRIYIYL